jgi:hypothetical protein
MRRFLILGLTVTLALARADAKPLHSEVLAEVERIEDMRLLLFYSFQDLHGGRSLAEYLKGFGGPDRMVEVEDLVKEGLWVYEHLKAVDDSGTALQVAVDAKLDASLPEHLAIVQRGRAVAAQKLLDHRQRVSVLVNELREQLLAAAEAKQQPFSVHSEPMPWGDDPREADRARGFAAGWNLPLVWTNDGKWAKFEAIQPSASLPYLLAKARKLGITFISTADEPLTSWAHIEKEKGKYDFAALDAAMGKLEGAGLKAVLRLHALNSPAPSWLGEGTSLVNAEGKPISFYGEKGGGSINLFNPTVREPFFDFLKAYGSHVRQKWSDSVMAVYVGGEELEISRGGFDQTADFSAFSRAHWQQWLTKKNKPVAEFPKPDEAFVVPPSGGIRAEPPEGGTTNASAKWSDWLSWREDWLTEYVQMQREVLQAVLGDIPVQSRTINDDMHRIFAEWFAPIQGKNLATLSRASANPNTGTTTPSSYEVLRSFSEGRWLWHYFMPIGCGAKTGACSFESVFHDVSTMSYNAGPEGPVRWLFPAGWSSYSDKQLCTFGIGAYFTTPREIERVADCVLNTERAPASVAILWSQSSLHFDGNQRMRIEAMAMGHLLTRTFFPFEYVSEDQLRAGKLAQYNLLILPGCKYLPADVCRSIRVWVEAGGTLLGTSAPSLFDELGGGGKALQLGDVFGAQFERFIVPTGVEPDKLYTGHPEGAYSQPAPLPYQMEADMCAVISPQSATPQAWYFGSERKSAAIAQHTFGKGKAILCGYALGNEYYNANPYEIYFGAALSRTAGGYTEEQVQKEKWIIKLLGSLGVERPLVITKSDILRAQNRDDGDWFHVYQRGPSYAEYQWETDNHVHSFVANTRQRAGTDTTYLCVMNTEMNYLLERGYMQAFVTAARNEVQTRAPNTKRLVDVGLDVAVPFAQSGDTITFTTWTPLSQGKMFAASPSETVRLFGNPRLAGVQPDELETRCTEYTKGRLSDVTVIDRKAVREYVHGLRGREIVIGCGTPDYLPAAEDLAKHLKARLQITAKPTLAGARTWVRHAYQDGFGYSQARPEEADAAILIGNTVDNGLMFRYEWHWTRDRHWLPLNVNATFPGAGHAVIQLSLPVQTTGSGLPEHKPTERKLILGASNPNDAARAVEWLIKHGS